MLNALKGLHFFSRFAYSFSALGYRQRRFLWSDYPADFRDQTWLITGASGGIGRAIATGAADGGARVMALARSVEKLADLEAEVDEGIVAHPIDLSLKQNIGVFLDEMEESANGSPVDVLVNNVGVLLNKHQLSEEGFELSFATNLLNHYLLTSGLIERGLLADDAVIVNMSSGGMYNVPLKIDRLNEMDADRYDGVLAYAYHKRAQVALNAWWRERYSDRDWCFYVMHPGWVDTEGVKTSLPGFRALFQHVLRDAAAGADTALWLAATRPLQQDDGSIWFDREERNAHLGRSTQREADDVEALVEFLEGL